MSLKHLSPTHKNFIVNLNTQIIPNTVSEALTKREWKDDMREEMSALEKNKTWEIVERPKGKNIVDCKWIFTLKYKADGSLKRHKARLVAKGYTQTYGVDYQETFALLAKMNTIRILLSLATHYNWKLLQYDVKNAFLHGDLDGEIYMNIPPTSNKVCKLKKALYGLKQSPRAWFRRFSKVMKEFGYKQSQGDHTLFIKHSAAGGVTRGGNRAGREWAGPKLTRFFWAKILTAQPALKTGPVGPNSLFKAKKNSDGPGRAIPGRAKFGTIFFRANNLMAQPGPNFRRIGLAHRVGPNLPPLGVTALLIHVDDIIVTGNDEREKNYMKQRLAKEFEIKEQGKLKYFLDIEVAYSTQGILISQQKYVIDLLVETGKIGCKPVSTPMDPKERLKKNQWWIKECTRGWLVGSYTLLTLG